MAHKHTYQRLSDDAVFCRDCGDIKRSEPPVCTLPHYPVYPYVPQPVSYPPIWVQPWRPPTVPWWTVTNGTADTVTTGLVVGNTTTYMPDNVTFTAGES